MRALRIYLDTSVISHLFHEDTPERRSDTVELFENAIANRIHETFVSTVVIDELNRTRDEELRGRFLAVLANFPIRLLPDGGEEVIQLARAYIQRGILSPSNLEDALHVAYATVFELDVLVTWNYRHLARARTSSLISSVNLEEGYPRPLQVLTPLEVLQP